MVEIKTVLSIIYWAVKCLAVLCRILKTTLLLLSSLILLLLWVLHCYYHHCVCVCVCVCVFVLYLRKFLAAAVAAVCRVSWSLYVLGLLWAPLASPHQPSSQKPMHLSISMWVDTCTPVAWEPSPSTLNHGERYTSTMKKQSLTTFNFW